MNQQAKVCPLLVADPCEPVNRRENHYTCIGERCAWYTCGECAVLCAARTMADAYQDDKKDRGRNAVKTDADYENGESFI